MRRDCLPSPLDRSTTVIADAFAVLTGECTSARVLIVAAHPDDEVIGSGSRLALLRDGVSVVHVTDGAPRDGGDAADHGFRSLEEYRGARRRELLDALELAGIRAEQTRELSYSDQTACHHLVSIANDVLLLLREIEPDVVLTHSYEGGHPDHDATALAVHAGIALWSRNAHPAAHLVEMTSYHDGPVGITTGVFLPADVPEPELVCALSPADCELKRHMMECFESQSDMLQYFPVGRERFRIAPHYRFTAPPHVGTLFYEQFPWGMTGAAFRQLAAAALRELGLEEPL